MNKRERDNTDWFSTDGYCCCSCSCSWSCRSLLPASQPVSQCLAQSAARLSTAWLCQCVFHTRPHSVSVSSFALLAHLPTGNSVCSFCSQPTNCPLSWHSHHRDYIKSDCTCGGGGTGREEGQTAHTSTSTAVISKGKTTTKTATHQTSGRHFLLTLLFFCVTSATVQPFLFTLFKLRLTLVVGSLTSASADVRQEHFVEQQLEKNNNKTDQLISKQVCRTNSALEHNSRILTGIRTLHTSKFIYKQVSPLQNLSPLTASSSSCTHFRQ